MAASQQYELAVPVVRPQTIVLVVVFGDVYRTVTESRYIDYRIVITPSNAFDLVEQ